MSEMPALPLQEHVEVRALPETPSAMAIAVDHTTRRWREVHSHYTICATVAPVSGRSHGSIRYRGQDHEVRPGLLMLMEPGEVHVTKALDGTACFRLLQVAPGAIADMLGRTEDDRPWHWDRVTIDHPGLVARFVNAHDTAMRAGSAEGLGPVLHDLMTLAGDEPARSETARMRAELVAVADCLRRRYLEHPTLQELAQEVGLKRYRLVQLFSRELGLPPMQYLLEWRLGIARRALARGSHVTEAAHDAGFYDQAQFCRQFGRAHGITPGRFRAALHTPGPRD